MAFVNYYYSGQGSFYAAKRDPLTGKPMGFVRVGNVPEATIDIEVTKYEHKESETGSRSIDLAFPKEKKGKFTIKAENMTLENLAMGFYGVSTKVTGGSAVTKTSYHKGMRVPLDHPDVSDVEIMAVDGTTPLVLGTDYTLDAKNGVVTFSATAPTPAITEGALLNTTYTYGDYTNLEAFTSASAPERWIRFEGLNTIDNSRVIVDMFRAQFDPLTGYALINEELGSMNLTGVLLADPFIDPTTGASQFFRQRNVAA